MPKLETLELEIKNSVKNTAAIDKLSKALRELGSASGTAGKNTSDLTRLTTALSNITTAANSAGGVSTKIKKIGDALSGLISSVSNVNQVADGLEKVSAALSKISNVSGGASAAVRAVKEISDTGKATADKQSGLAPDDSGASPAAATEDIEDAGDKADVSAEKIERMLGILSGVGKSASNGQIKDAVDGLKEISRVLNETNIEQAREAMTKLQQALASGDSKGISEAVKGLQDVISKLPEAEEKTHRFKSALQGLNGVGGKLKTVLAKPFMSFKDRIVGAAKSATQLLASLKRVATYRALRTAIKAVTSGLKDGIEHLYKWSALVDNTFKDSMDSLASSAHYLKDSFAAMVSPIIDALAPAVEYLVNKFVDLMNVVNQFFATITGKDSWRKAVKQQDKYIDDTDKASAAQKKLNKQLMAFDELNNITTSTSGGRGSSKDDGIDDDHFTTEELPDWFKGIREAIENGEWYSAGALLAEKLNGMIDQWDAKAFGKSIGEKFQNGISAYLGFMKTFNWKQLGIKSADFINGVLSEVNPTDLGEAIVQKFNAAIGYLSGFAERFDWSAAGEWLADVLIGAFTGIDWEEFAEMIGNFATGLLNMIKSAIEELWNHKGEILSKIGDFISGLWGEDGSGFFSVVKIAGLVAGWRLIFGAALPKAISGLGGVIGSAFTNVFGSSAVSSAIEGGVSSAVSSGVSAGAAAGATSGGFTSALSGLGSAFVSFMGTWGLPILGAVGITAGVLAAAKAWDEKSDAEFEQQKQDPAYSYSVAEDLKHMIDAGEKALTDDQLGLNLMTFKNAAESIAFETRGEVFFDAVNGLEDVPGVLEQAKKWLDKYTTTSTPQTEASSTNWMHSDRSNRQKVEIDTTSAVTSINEISTAAVNARKHVTALPPSDDTVSQFVDKAVVMAGSTKDINTAAVKARSKVKALPPSDDEVSKFTDNALKMANSLGGKTGSVKSNAASAKTGVNDLDKSLTNTGKKKYTPSLSVTGLSTATTNSGKFNKNMNGIKTKYATKMSADGLPAAATNASKFNSSMGGVKTKYATSITAKDLAARADNAFSLQTGLNSLKAKYETTVSSSSLTERANEAKRLYDNLNNVNVKSWRISVTGDMKLKMTSERGNTMYFVEPYADGGMPTMGDIFIANEAGPELIGTINGRNAVASNGEITGIADAVYTTGEDEARLLREQNQLLRQLLAKKSEVTLAPNVAAGRWVSQATTAYRKATGG